MKFPHHSKAFTLIELIVVLVIIGVLAVSLVPRFFTTAGTSEYLYQDQVLNLLRRAQIQAMQCTDCTAPAVTVSSNNVFIGSASCADADAGLALCAAPRDNISLTLNAASLQFDSLGRPLGCTGNCRLSVQGSVALNVCIETEGYIHPC